MRVLKNRFLVLLLLLSSSQNTFARSTVHAFDPLMDLRDEPATRVRDLLPFDGFGFLRDFLMGSSNVVGLVQGTYDQLLDPANSVDGRTFKQRYYVYSQHADGPQSPVVYYICGESECLARSFLGRFVEDVATALHAHIVALEHRYYGQSIPFNSLTTANLQYLSTSNALADLVFSISRRRSSTSRASGFRWEVPIRDLSPRTIA
jgi:hypothetical protein